MIEDEETLLGMYKMKFESESFNFLGVRTGEEGISLAEEKCPDLVLIDLILESKVGGGKIDGFVVLQQLKENKKTKNIPMYALTNLNQDSDIERAKELGVDGYFVKSDLTPKELVENIKKIFRGEKVGVIKSEA